MEVKCCAQDNTNHLSIFAEGCVPKAANTLIKIYCGEQHRRNKRNYSEQLPLFLPIVTRYYFIIT